MPIPKSRWGVVGADLDLQEARGIAPVHSVYEFTVSYYSQVALTEMERRIGTGIETEIVTETEIGK